MVRTVLAFGVAVLLGTRIQVVQTLHPGALLAMAAVPFWWSASRRFRGARAIIALSVVMAGSGYWLTEFARATHSVSTVLQTQQTLLVLSIAAMIGMFLWLRTSAPEWLLTLGFGVGMLGTTVLLSDGLGDNPWKFGYAVPTALIALSIAHRIGGFALQAVAALLLAGVSAVQDSRSAFGLFVLTAMLLLFQLKPVKPGRRKSALRTAVGLALTAVVIFQLGQAAVLEGALGEATRERSERQVEQSGSLLLGSRPEAAATVALLVARPFGYGSGTLPNLDDLRVAKTGQSEIGYNPDNGYVDHYMFGLGYEVHSILGDYWIRFGLPGLAFVLLLVTLLVRGIAQRLAESNASGVALFVGAQTLWSVLFSPIFASAPLLVVAVATLLAPRAPRTLDQGP
ncbi:MAG TPA: hypothetical protein VFU07_06330 [Candidatus Lumbricidophila sp.]|nr:hypothetical protein [Candidatus Lumbricidophila sp.]